ncbi:MULTISPECIES: flagellin [unclassified Yoonia]|uniref:flagellin n=1 Tax=unclassified Yoonia TaxID=2629118 RepID=UPI002AFFDA0C|nr:MULTISPECIES: flagellin [unclassified Yoonia]
MSVTRVGDMAQQFLSQRAGGAIKSDLLRLSNSLSSGRVDDIPRHLNGETARFTGITHKLAQIEGFRLVGRETGQMLDGIQTVLGRVDSARSQLAGQILLVSDSSTAAQVDDAARLARGAFDTMVSALNTRLADRAILSGRDVQTTPLLAADAMMADLQAAIGADRTFAGIEAAVTSWFDDPLGGFAVAGYQGDTGATLQRQVSQDQRINISARADDPAIRATLKAVALAAVTSDLPGLGDMAKMRLVQASGGLLFGAASQIVAMQSRVGSAQAVLAETQAELAAQETGLQMAVNDLILADPFDTATRLQSVQLQLETHYSVVGRLSQLSLLRFI